MSHWNQTSFSQIHWEKTTHRNNLIFWVYIDSSFLFKMNFEKNRICNILVDIDDSSNFFEGQSILIQGFWLANGKVRIFGLKWSLESLLQNSGKFSKNSVSLNRNGLKHSDQKKSLKWKKISFARKRIFSKSSRISKNRTSSKLLKKNNI